MEFDDGVRETVGVVASLRDGPDGRLHLILDDVESVGAEEPRRWRAKTFFTVIGYDRERFVRSNLSERQFADIGLAVVARLAALKQV